MPAEEPDATNGDPPTPNRVDEEHEHRGSYGEGQEEREHHPEREARGDFAEGQERADHDPDEVERRGTFAEGTAERPRLDRPEGDFAEGAELDDD